MENQFGKPEYGPGWQPGGHCMPPTGLARCADSQPHLRACLLIASRKTPRGLTEIFFVVILIFCFADTCKIKVESDTDSTLAAGLRSTEIFEYLMEPH